MIRTEGYYDEQEYTSGYYHELGPAHLRFCALVAGLEAPPVRPLTYLELGMGQGVSLVFHAAANEGAFWGVDLHPVHVANAQALADAVGAQVRLAEQSFADFAARDDLPAFDVITLHGVWSWVSEANRRIIVDLIRDRLAPGGLVYLSYNCQPGWASRAPVRHLLKLGRSASQATTADEGIEAALAFAEEVAAADGRFFADTRAAASHLASLRKADARYVGHEYLGDHWHVPYFADVAGALSGADLSFASSARLLDRVTALHLQPAGAALLDRQKDPVLKEGVRDYLVSQQFRPDVFARSPRPLSQAEQIARFDAQAFVLICGLDEIDFDLTGAQGQMTLPEDLYRPIALALAGEDFRPRTPGDLLEASGMAGIRRSDVIAALVNLVGMGVVRPAQTFGPESRARCDAFNRLVLERAVTGPHLKHLASPATGGGILTPRSAQLFLRAWLAGDRSTDAIARSVWAVFQTTNERAARKGETLTTEEANLEVLGEMAERFLDQTIPLYRALAIL